MYILGISCFYHDSAAALIKDGDIVAAAQEERFTRKKHDHSFPKNAVKYCLEEAGITSKEIGYVAFYDKPFIKFERILETYLAYAPAGIRSFMRAVPLWVKKKLWMKELIRKELQYDGVIIFPEHHEAHAASGSRSGQVRGSPQRGSQTNLRRALPNAPRKRLDGPPGGNSRVSRASR